MLAGARDDYLNLIEYIGNTEGMLKYEAGRDRIGFLEDNAQLIRGGNLGSLFDLDFWANTQGALAGLSNFGPILSPDSAGGRFGLIHTGLGSASSEGRIDQLVISPRTAAATFKVQYNFVTTEFPQFLGTQFNDTFSVTITDVSSGASKTLVSFGGELNKLFSPGDPVVQGLPSNILDHTAGGQTGWQVKSLSNLHLKQGGRYLVQFRVNDVGDAVFDSALLINKASLR